MIKKIASGILAITLVFGSSALPTELMENATNNIAITANAYKEEDTITSHGFDYGVLANGTAEITKYIGTDNAVVIPSKIDGKTVTSIAHNAFMYSNFNSITIPNTVVTIKDNAFNSCTKLSSISISQNVKSIGNDVFALCVNLRSINVNSKNKNYSSADGILYNKNKSELIFCPRGTTLSNITVSNSTVKIDEAAFAQCGNIKHVTLPKSITTIGSNAFLECKGLGNIVIPNSVTKIADGAFDNCVSLESVTLSENIKSIEENTFKECSSLKSIVIPNSVTSIGDSAFISCSNLKNAVLSNKLKTIKEHAFENCCHLEEIVIPDSVTSIGTDTFRSCSSMKKATLSNSLITITDGAFMNCLSLTSVTIPNKVKNIGDYAFYGCAAVAKISLPNTVTRIGNYAFFKCNETESLTVPNSVNEIGTCAFYNCTNLKDITFSDNLTKLGAFAFEYTKWFENQPDGMLYIGKIAYIYKGDMEENASITIKDGTISIAGGAFYVGMDVDLAVYPSTLVDIKIPESVKYIGDYAFKNCTKLSQIKLPNSITSIENNTFENCFSLKSITIPDNVTSIGDAAFYSCVSLEKVAIPSKVNSIGISAFSNCSSLSEISMPDSLETIGDYAFELCYSLKTITMPKNVSEIGDGIFFDCKNLEEIKADKCLYISSSDGILYDKSKETLILCPQATKLTNFVMPNTVEKIEYGAFSGCKSLKSVKISNKLTLIDEYAFSDCSNLKKITISDSVQNIKNTAFEGTAWYANQPNGVVYAGKIAYAYKGTICQQNITLKDGTIGVSDYVFANLKNLKSVTVPFSVKYFGDFSFGNKFSGVEVYCGRNTMTEYYAKRNGLTYWYYTDSMDDKVVMLSASSFVYDGKAKKPTVKINGLTNKIDYMVSYSNNKNAGTATVSITGKDNYTGTIKKTFKITAKKISGLTAKLSKASYTYTGKSLKPTVAIKGLKNGTDFTVSYKSNKSIGVATVTIKGKGNYSGTKTLKFTILPSKQTIKLSSANNAFKVSWKKYSQATGYQISYSTKSNFKGAKTYTAGKLTTSKTIKGKDKTKYYVRVRTYKTVGGVKRYGAWSTSKSVKTK